MTAIGVTTRGLDRALAAFQRRMGRLKGVQSANVQRAAHHLFREAQEVVPIDHGHLAASGGVRRSLTDPLSAEVTYDADYAFIVHERPEHIVFKRPSARHKWLEVTAIEHRDTIARIAKTGTAG